MSLRTPALLLSVLALGLSFAPAAVSAQGSSARFVAQLVSPATEARVVAGGVIWRCEESQCSAALNGTRPLRMCRELGRELGPVVRFEADGAALSEDDLARCNA
jgi:hypothetical protein